jgi:hypothetical protein
VRASVRFILPDGSQRDLAPGDLVGRLWSAALHLDDGRISEAHAMVSLRGSVLCLLALRGRFTVDGTPRNQATLAAGQTIHVAPDLALQVARVRLPERVLALEGEGLPRRVLSGACSLRVRPAPSLTAGFDGAAPAQLWNTGTGWSLRLEGRTRALGPGDRFTLEGRSFQAVAVDPGVASAQPTRGAGAFTPPITLIAEFDRVRILREAEPAVTLSGVSARILSELVAFDGPVSWEVLAREIWTDGADTDRLRRRWDVGLARLRSRLREAGVRDDLVSSMGTGMVGLVRHANDVFEDRT